MAKIEIRLRPDELRLLISSIIKHLSLGLIDLADASDILRRENPQVAKAATEALQRLGHLPKQETK